MKYLKTPREVESFDTGNMHVEGEDLSFCRILIVTLANAPCETIEDSEMGACLLRRMRKADDNKDEKIEIEKAEIDWLTNKLKAYFPKVWGYNGKNLFDLFEASLVDSKEEEKA